MTLRFRSSPLPVLFAVTLLSVVVFSSSSGSAAQTGNQAGSPKKGAVEFSRDIAPIFQASCGNCHSGTASMGRLKLDSEGAILAGGASGPAITPGHSGNSLLVKRILGLTEAPRMPMNGDPLGSEQVKLIRRWIDEADFSSVAATSNATAGKESTAPAEEKTSNTSGSALFADKVRPILARRCYPCHGPEVQQNGLRLDSLRAILRGSESGKVVVPGHSDESRLMRRLLTQERPGMPYGGPPLAKDEIGVIRQWIDAGASGPDASTPIAVSHQPTRHWAYVKPVRPTVPQVKDAAWCRNPIDNFILARLEKEGIKPSPEADKPTLIRRVYLDLVGLPPSPQEVDAFVADKSPDAYDKVVDHLLASSHYGERWARPWLDLARYADSNGYEADRRRTAWEYRDWVIRALNQDLSFRDFTIDQIAGDMLPHPTQDQLIATGFNRNTMLNQEGGVDPEEYYWYSLVDRVNTTGSVWLGLTVGCAQCHNHKFDPITQKDYYRLLAFYGNSEYKQGPPGDRWVREPELELPTPEQKTKSKEYRAQIAELQRALDTPTAQLDAAQKNWEKEIQTAEAQWTALAPDRYESAGGASLKLLPDGSIMVGGKNPQADTYTVEAKTDRDAITGIRLEVLTDPSLPHGGPGRDAEGNFFLSAFDVEAAPRDHPEAKQHIVWKEAAADESQEGYGIKKLVKNPEGEGRPGWAIDASANSPRRQAVFVPDKPFGFPGGTILSITMKHEMRKASRNVGRFRVSVSNAADPRFIVQVPAGLRPVLDITPDKRTPEQSQKLAAAYRAVSPLLDETRKQIAALQDSMDKLGIVTAMTMAERPGYTRPATYIRERGSFTSVGEQVYADVPSFLNPLPKDAMPNRLGLAEWLVSDDNPLTARVAVNRFWETLFGHGLVETSEDFGSQGDPPSHPELLDWLATEFEGNGWSMKKIQRLMVTSATYRQSSRATPDLLARDPYNKLYARGARFRVEAEMVHDIALASSGLLSPKMYGPSVFPYQPEGILDLPYNDEKWVESKGEDRYRRAVYTMIHRSAPYPSLATFDAPSRELCTVRRVRTNTPLQALTVLNDPYFFDAARELGKRMVSEGGQSVRDRATYGFRLVAARRPTDDELAAIVKFYDQQLASYKQDTREALRLVADTGGTESAPDLAAWTMVANVLLNMDETISKE